MRFSCLRHCDFTAISAGKACDFKVVIANGSLFVIAIAWVTEFGTSIVGIILNSCKALHYRKEFPSDFLISSALRSCAEQKPCSKLQENAAGDLIHVM